MRGPALVAGTLTLAWALSACSGDTGSKASIEAGEYSGVSVTGQSLVIEVVGDKVRVNAVKAELDDPTTNASFSVDIGGTKQDFSCSNGNDGHTLTCTVKRARQLTVQVPCNLLAASPSASASVTPAASAIATPASATPSPSPLGASTGEATLPSAAALCSATLPNAETVSLLHLCSSAPCPDQSS